MAGDNAKDVKEGNQALREEIADEHNIVHGAGKVKSDHVDRADKTAPMPEIEKGEALKGFDASATPALIATEQEGEGSEQSKK